MSKSIVTTGKRKTAIATASLVGGDGKVLVNNKPVERFGADLYVLRIKEPLLLAGDVTKKVDIRVTVKGGGVAAQADAVRLAIAQALAEHKKALEDVFMDYDRTLLVADVRRKEPKKPNNRGSARSRRQKSYR